MEHIKSFRQWYRGMAAAVCQVDIWEDADKNVVLFTDMGFGAGVINQAEHIAKKVFPKRTTRQNVRYFVAFPQYLSSGVDEVIFEPGFVDVKQWRSRRDEELFALTGHRVRERAKVNEDLLYPPGIGEFVDCLKEKRKRKAARDLTPECDSTSSTDEVKEGTEDTLAFLELNSLPDRVITLDELKKLQEEHKKIREQAALGAAPVAKRLRKKK